MNNQPSSQVETIFVAVLQYLALDSAGQLKFTDLKVPSRSSRPARDLRDGDNDLVGLAHAYIAYYQPFFSETTHPITSDDTILDEIKDLLEVMLGSPDPRLWIRDALQRAPIWNVLRRLARHALKEMKLPTGPPAPDVLKAASDTYP